MNKKLKSISLIFLMISSLVIPTVQGNLQNHPNTELTLTSDYFGSTLDGGFVYTTANPSFELVVNNSGNSTIYGTEFEYITADLTYNSNYSSMFQIPVNHTSDIDLKYISKPLELVRINVNYRI